MPNVFDLPFSRCDSLTRTSRDQTRKLIASGLPRDYLDSGLKILSNLEVILRLKKGFGLKYNPKRVVG
jgi:hypothetical protein